MDLILLLIIFFSLLVIIIKQLKAMHKTRQAWINASYTKPNLHQYAGYWQWPKGPKI